MSNQVSELASMMSRLEQLEKENQRVKRVGLSLLTALGCVILMAQARPNNNKTIEAENFVVKDASGNTRAVLGINGDHGGASLILGSENSSIDGKEKYAVHLHGGDYAWLNMRAGDESEYINAVINSDNGPVLSLSDKNGFETDIGQSNLVTTQTGETHLTSSASAVMFGKDKKVLWSAP